MAKNRGAEAHAGATIQTIHNVAVNRTGCKQWCCRERDSKRYTTQELYGELLARFDGDPTRDGLLKTPERMEKAMTFLTQGYRQDPQEILRARRSSMWITTRW